MLTRPTTARAPQRGAALILTLIVLVILISASTAMIRSVDTSIVIAGNLALKQTAAPSADMGIESAIAWLQDNNTAATLYSSIPASGYVAFRDDPAAGQSWDSFWTTTIATSGQVVTLDPDSVGNRVSYIIHRLCTQPGAPTAGVGCAASPVSSATGSSKGAGMISPVSGTQVYYRITARVDGPRNTVSYVQVVVAM